MMFLHDLYWLDNLVLVRSEEDTSSLAPAEKRVTEAFHPKFTYPVWQLLHGSKHRDLRCARANTERRLDIRRGGDNLRV